MILQICKKSSSLFTPFRRTLTTPSHQNERPNANPNSSSQPPSEPAVHPNPPPIPLTYLRTPSGRIHPSRVSPANLPNSPEFGLNQNITIDKETRQRLKEVLERFNAPIKYAFAYGSGVFNQSGYSTDSRSPPMIDFIFGVTHPYHWHALNLQNNRGDYSFLGMFGSYSVNATQENIGAGVYFNPYVHVNGMQIKYGVVSIDRLCQDLLHWDTLYLAGRMHKPVKVIRDDARVRLANQVNLTSVLRLALLTLPPRFTERDLYARIAAVSYTGDFRTRVGENPNKIQNIVSAQMLNFRSLYEPLIDDFPYCSFIDPSADPADPKERTLEQEIDPRYRAVLVQKLPRSLYKRVTGAYLNSVGKVTDPEHYDAAKINREVAEWDGLTKSIERGVEDISWRPAITQSLKGILTAGPVKSVRYVGEKLGKWWEAKR